MEFYKFFKVRLTARLDYKYLYIYIYSSRVWAWSTLFLKRD